MPTVLINGIGGNLARLVAKWLLTRPDVRVVGLDTSGDVLLPGRIEMHVGSPNATELADLIRCVGADTVIHLRLIGEEQATRAREAAVQTNVLGCMEAIGAAFNGGARRIVLRSSTLIYGAHPDHPALLPETRRIGPTPRSTILRDYQEIEVFANDFVQKRAAFELALLRCAPLVGGSIDSPLTRYLLQPQPRMLLGFDPRIQVLHPEDAARAFGMAALAHVRVSGPFNIATEATPLGRVLALAGRAAVPVPHPLAEAAARMGAPLRDVLGVPYFHIDYLRYSCVADTRRAREVLEFVPEIPLDQAVRELRDRLQLPDAA